MVALLQVLLLVAVVILLPPEFSVSSSPIPNEDWAEAHNLANGYSPRQCQPIPENMTLCQSVGYDNMALPNYFQQDSLQEAVQQSNAWLPLLKAACHPEVKRFLCSLYAPVCLKGHQELKIVPCRSLCLAVQNSCLSLLKKFGFDWPASLNCERFPINDGLCISPLGTSQNQPVVTLPSPAGGNFNYLDTHASTDMKQGVRNTGRAMQDDVNTKECPICSVASPTSENILTHYCQADFVLKSKIRSASVSNGEGFTVLQLGKKVNQFKPKSGKTSGASPKIRSLQSCTCAWFDKAATRGPYFIAGRILSRSPGGESVTYEVSYIVPWEKENREFKQAIRRIKRQGEAVCKSSASESSSFLQRKSRMAPDNALMSVSKIEVIHDTTETKEDNEKLNKKRERRRRYRQRLRERCKLDNSRLACKRRKKNRSNKSNNQSTNVEKDKNVDAKPTIPNAGSLAKVE